MQILPKVAIGGTGRLVPEYLFHVSFHSLVNIVRAAYHLDQRPAHHSMYNQEQSYSQWVVLFAYQHCVLLLTQRAIQETLAAPRLSHLLF